MSCLHKNIEHNLKNEIKSRLCISDISFNKASVYDQHINNLQSILLNL